MDTNTMIDHTIARVIPKYALLLSICVLSSLTTGSHAQSASYPGSKSPLPDNPYLKNADPWRWDIRTQIFLRAGVRYFNNPGDRNGTYSTGVDSARWPIADLDVIYPVVREGGFYWSPNKAVSVSIRADDLKITPKPARVFTKGTKAEYTLWRSDIRQEIHQIQLTHISHIVSSDTIFDQTKARQLAWPDKWNDEATSWLTPVVESVGKKVPADAADKVKELLDLWVDHHDPKEINEVDLAKFLTGKVIEHVQVRTPPAEFSTRSGNRFSAAAFVGAATWSGFVVRPANEVARTPAGSKHDLATLLTGIFRSAGIPARTVLCVNQSNDDVLEKMVSMVEFAMYDPVRDLTFWVPVDVDRLRLNGKRASQYKQWWNYFGTNDELNNYVPVAYYFHPPASYRAYDLPALYGIRSKSELPGYVIQSLLIDPTVSLVSAPKMKTQP